MGCVDIKFSLWPKQKKACACEARCEVFFVKLKEPEMLVPSIIYKERWDAGRCAGYSNHTGKYACYAKYLQRGAASRTMEEQFLLSLENWRGVKPWCKENELSTMVQKRWITTAVARLRVRPNTNIFP